MAKYLIMSTNYGWDGVFTSAVLGLVDIITSDESPRKALLTHAKEHLETEVSYDEFVEACDNGEPGQYFSADDSDDSEYPFDDLKREIDYQVVEAYSYGIDAWLGFFDEDGLLQLRTIITLEPSNT